MRIRVFSGREFDRKIHRLLRRSPSAVPQQSPSWRNTLVATGGDQPIFVGAFEGDQLLALMPSYRFVGALGTILVSCPQVGPMGGFIGDEELISALVEQLIAVAVDTECDLTTVISNPFLPDDRPLRRALQPDFDLLNTCQVLDLQSALDASESYRSATDSHRRNLKKALAAPIRVRDAKSVNELEIWYEIHQTRHRQLGLKPLPRELITNAWTFARHGALPFGVTRFIVVEHTETGEIIAGGMYLQSDRIIDAVMPALKTEAEHLRPLYALHHQVIVDARRRGLHFFNWQPSPPGSGVERFKKQWGSVDHSYHYLTKITGDPTQLLSSSPHELREHYGTRFVVPFDVLGSGVRKKRSTRASTWIS